MVCVFITSTGWLCKLAFTVSSVCVLQAIGRVHSLDTGILGSPVPLTTSHPPACGEMEASVFPSDGVGAIPASWSTVTFRNASLSPPSHPHSLRTLWKKQKVNVQAIFTQLSVTQSCFTSQHSCSPGAQTNWTRFCCTVSQTKILLL